MTSQCEKIVEYIRKYGFITQFTGYRALGITCTSQRISDLRRRGYKVITRYAQNETGARYAIWTLVR